MAAAGRPAGDQADHDLRHEADQPLALQDVQASEPGPVDGLGGLAVRVLISRPPADALVAAGAEGPRVALRARPVAGEQHAADVARRTRMLEVPQQLVDRVRAE